LTPNGNFRLARQATKIIVGDQIDAAKTARFDRRNDYSLLLFLRNGQRG